MDFLEQAKELIAIDSCFDQGTLELVEKMQAIAESYGLGTEVHENGENAILLCYKDLRKAKDLVFLSHLDTADPGPPSLWDKTGHNPYKMQIIGDEVYGLGVADCKLDFLAKVRALSKLEVEANQRRPILVGTYGAESSFEGCKWMMKQNLITPDFVFVGEPSQLKLITQSSGTAIVEISILLSKEEINLRQRLENRESTATQNRIFRGVSSHASSPSAGKSAFVELLEYLKQLPEGLIIVSMDSGFSPLILPNEAFLEIDVNVAEKDQVRSRVLESFEKIDEFFFGRMKKMMKNEENFPPYNIGKVRTLEDRILMQGCFYLPEGVDKQRIEKWLSQLNIEGAAFKLLEYSPASKLNQPERQEVQICQSILRKYQMSDALELKHKTTEASYFQSIGIDAIAFGSGPINGSSHSANERNQIQQLELSEKIYHEWMEKLSQ